MGKAICVRPDDLAVGECALEGEAQICGQAGRAGCRLAADRADLGRELEPIQEFARGFGDFDQDERSEGRVDSHSLWALGGQETDWAVAPGSVPLVYENPTLEFHPDSFWIKRRESFIFDCKVNVKP